MPRGHAADPRAAGPSRAARVNTPAGPPSDGGPPQTRQARRQAARRGGGPAKAAARAADRAFYVFLGAVAVFALAWYFGLSIRVPLFTTHIEMVRASALPRVLRGGLSDWAGVMAVMAIVSGAYLVALWALRRGFPHAFAWVIAGSVVVAVAALPQAPAASPDTTHFAADVRTLWLHGTWPAQYRGSPAFQDDPVAREVRIFADRPSGYGPVAYALGGAPLPFVGDGLRANVFGQKVLSGTLFIVIVVLTGLVARRLGYNPALAAGLVGLNPMFVLQFPGDGHNDTMMVTFAMLGAWLLVTLPVWRGRVAAAAAGVLAVLGKYSMIVIGPLLLASWLPARPEVRLGRLRAPAWRAALGLAVVVVGIGAIAVLAPNRGADSGTLGPLLGISEGNPYHIIQQWLDLDRDGAFALVMAAYVLLFVATALIIALHPLDTHRDLLAAIALLFAFFLFVASPTLRSWYLLWGFPFIVLGGRRWLIAGAVTLSLLGIVQTLALQWEFSWKDAGVSHASEWAVAAAWVVTIAVAYGTWRRDRRHPVGRSPVAAVAAGSPAPAQRAASEH